MSESASSDEDADEEATQRDAERDGAETTRSTSRNGGSQNGAQGRRIDSDRKAGGAGSLDSIHAPIDRQDVFSNVYGHEGAKLILRNALRSGDEHVLMVGPPGSGKSAFLHSLESNLPGVEYWDSKALKPSKLQDILAANPPILMIDEFDRLSMDCYDVLSVPMEHGRIQKASSSETYDRRIETQIIASMNETSRVPNNILSRFGEPIRFEEYSTGEYLDVCERMLIDEAAWIETPRQAREVAKIAYDMTGSTDPRRARRIAKLATSFDEVEKVTKALHDPDADIGGVTLAPTEIARTKEQVQRQRLTQIAVRDAEEMINRRFDRDREGPPPETPGDVARDIEDAIEEEIEAEHGR